MNSYADLDLNELILLVRDKSDAAFSELLFRYGPLINSISSGFITSSFSFDEAFSDACVALHKAAMSYDLMQTEVTFGLYAKICIRNRLVSIKRKEKKNSKKSAPYTKLENQVRETGRGASREKLEDNEKVISELSSYEKSVLDLYLSGHSYREIGLALNKSEKSVDNALYRIKSKLKQLI